MATNKEITATEKLLDMIRRDDATPMPSALAGSTAPLVAAPPPSKGENQAPAVLTLEKEAAPPPAADSPRPTPPPPTSGTQLTLEREPLPVDLPEEEEGEIAIDPDPAPPTPAPTATARPRPPFLAKIKYQLRKLRRRATITVGVEIDPEYIGLVKMNTAVNPALLLDYRVVPLTWDEEEKKDAAELLFSPGFQLTLQETLRDFCQGDKNFALWTTIALDHVTVSSVTIPKVAAAEIPTAVFWTVQKELKFDQASTIFDYSLLDGVSTDPKKLTAVVFMAKRQSVARLEELFTTCGYPLAGITVSAIAIQNLIQTGWVDAQEGTAAHLYFGEQKSYIDLYSHGYLLFGREIHTGITSFIESVLERASDNFLILDELAAKSCVFDSLAEGPDAGAGERAAATGDSCAIAMQELPATRRLVRQLERTFAYCSTHYGIKNIKGILTSGVAQLNQTIFGEINAELGISCAAIDPFAAAKFIAQPAVAHAPALTDRPRLLAAFGLALGDNRRCQNFLYTTADKNKQTKVQAVNKIIIGCFMTLSLLSLATFAWHRQVVQGKELALRKLAQTLEAQYQQTKGSGDSTYALGLAGKIQGHYKANLATAKRFYPVALLHEVAQTVPAPLQLTKLNFSTIARQGKERKGTEKEKATDSEEETVNQITLEGIIPGQGEQLNFLLVEFRQQLDASPLLAGSNLNEKKLISKAGQELLQFTMQMEPKKMAPPPPSTAKEN